MEDADAKKRTAKEAANVYTDVKDFSEVERIQIFLNQMVSTFGKLQVATEVQYSKECAYLKRHHDMRFQKSKPGSLFPPMLSIFDNTKEVKKMSLVHPIYDNAYKIMEATAVNYAAPYRFTNKHARFVRIMEDIQKQNLLVDLFQSKPLVRELFETIKQLIMDNHNEDWLSWHGADLEDYMDVDQGPEAVMNVPEVHRVHALTGIEKINDELCQALAGIQKIFHDLSPVVTENMYAANRSMVLASIIFYFFQLM